MYAFLVNLQPLSHQNKSRAGNKKRDIYKKAIESICLKEFPSITKYSEPLYGIVYFFNKNNSTIDADNMSKLIWDALSGILYDDDSAIRLRYAGVFDIASTEMSGEFDTTKLPDDVFERFSQMIDAEKHLLYIEVGKLDSSMYICSLEQE